MFCACFLSRPRHTPGHISAAFPVTRDVWSGLAFPWLHLPFLVAPNPPLCSLFPSNTNAHVPLYLLHVYLPPLRRAVAPTCRSLPGLLPALPPLGKLLSTHTSLPKPPHTPSSRISIYFLSLFFLFHAPFLLCPATPQNEKLPLLGKVPMDLKAKGPTVL